jgi:hypothetical protein
MLAMEAEHWPVLTIRQPWCWAITHAGKTVENRSWKTEYRGPLWLHAGARSRWDPAGAEFRPLRNAWGRHLLSRPGWPGVPESDIKLGRRTTLMPFGAVSALAEVTGCHHSEECMMPAACVTAAGRTGCSPWAVRGQWHIDLANVRPLADPVPCRGALGLWRLPEDAEKAVRAQLEAGDGT